MSFPALFTFIGAQLHERVVAPSSLGARAWVMGVMAVQITIDEAQPSAHLRCHTTGGRTPMPLELGPSEVVHVALAPLDGPLPALPAVSPPPLDGARARLTVSLNGSPRGSATLAGALLRAVPPPRAFGHAFCRWLRDGGYEAGFDLTDFVSQGEGLKYERTVSLPLEVGQVVSFGFASG